MTNREFYNLVISGVHTAEMVEFAKDSISKLDAANARRKVSGKQAERIADNAVLERSIAVALSAKDGLTTEIASTVGISTSKASGLLVKMEKAGIVDSTAVTVKGKGKQKRWHLIEA